MTDSLQDVQGAAAPASLSGEVLTEVHADSFVPAVAATPDVVVAEAPVQADAQAFAELGLAPELVDHLR